MGRLFSKLFDYRQQGNYGNFLLSEDKILPLVSEVQAFKDKVLALIEPSGNKNKTEL
jgi:hypothetical protein